MTAVPASPGVDGAVSPDVPAPGAMAGAVTALGGGEILSRLVAFGATTLVARRVGPDGFGILGFASALCGYFALAVGGGLNDLGARAVAQDPDRAARLYWTVVSVRVPLALVSLALLAVLAWLLPRPDGHGAVIALSGLSLLSLAIDPAWAIKALGRSSLAALGMIGTQVLVLAGVAMFVTGPASLLAAPVVQFGAETVTGVVLAAGVLRAIPGARPQWSDGAVLLRRSAPLLFGRGMRVVIVSFDMLMLGFVATSRDVGVYAAVYRIHFFILALGVAIQSAYLPVMARAAARGPAALREVADDALSGGAIIGAPLVAGGIVTAGPLLALLFGAPYAEGAQALQWLLVSLGFVFVHGLLHALYVVTDRTHIEARWFAAAAAVNVLSNLWLIPRYGIAGAAAATALAEAIIAFGGIFASRIASFDSVVAAWGKPAGAATVMAIVVWALGDAAPVAVRCALGALVYGGVMMGLLGPRTAAARLGMRLP